MIIKDSDAEKRLNSPMNLINKLTSSGSRKAAMSLFGMDRNTQRIEKKKKEELLPKIEKTQEQLQEEIRVSFNPFEKKIEELVISQAIPTTPPIVLDQIIENNDSQIKLGLAHDKALDLLNKSVELLAMKLDGVKADKLPATITAASKVVESIRRERNELNKNTKDREVHYHFYTPEQKRISEYEVIEVTS